MANAQPTFRGKVASLVRGYLHVLEEFNPPPYETLEKSRPKPLLSLPSWTFAGGEKEDAGLKVPRIRGAQTCFSGTFAETCT